MSAGLWCADLKLRALLLEAKSELGGQLLQTYNRIENHLGNKAENGREMRDIFTEQIKNRDFQIKCRAETVKVDLNEKAVELKTGEKFSADFLIIATGVRRRKLNIEGVEKFENRGILKSGKRDKDKTKDKKVLIVGGGDAAFENSLILAKTAEKVTLIHRTEKFSAREEFVEEARQNEKIEILVNTILEKIEGGEKIETAKLRNVKDDSTQNLTIDQILFRIGVLPNTEIFADQIELNENGYINIDGNCRTSVENVFAVGDVSNPLAPTISSAVGTGATAAKVISNFYSL